MTLLSASQSTFLTKVMLTMIAQLIVTWIVALVMYRMKWTNQLSSVWLWVFFAVTLIIAILMSFPQISTMWKLLLFTVFSIVFGMMLSPLFKMNHKILGAALAGTVAIFVSLFLVGIIVTKMKYDLSWMGWALCASLIGLLIAGVLGWIFGMTKTSERVYLAIGLVIFSLFVVFDTNMILRRQYKKDFVSAAFNYYLDFLNIFVRLVSWQKN